MNKIYNYKNNPQQKFIEIFEMSICTLYCNFISNLCWTTFTKGTCTKVFFTLSLQKNC